MDKRDKLYFREITDINYMHWPLFRKKDGSKFIRKSIFTQNVEINEGKNCLCKYVDDKYVVDDKTIGVKVLFRIILGFLLFFGLLLFIGNEDLLNGELYAIYIFVVFILATVFLGIFSFYHPPYIYIYIID